MSKSPVRFSVIGLNHGHIHAQARILVEAGAQLVSVYASEPELLAGFLERHPQAKAARCEAEVLEDPSVRLVASAAIPADRAPLGVRVMRHGKDFMSDKPGATTLEQLDEIRRAQAETRRIYSIFYAERLDNRASLKACELVRAGAVGRVVQTIGTGPHRINLPSRPDWFFNKQQYGGILVDLASHQMDQFLYLTDSASAEIVSSTVGNFNHPEYPGLEDFGDITVAGSGGMGYMRVDWFTPAGLATWGDARLFVIGTEGYIEARKYIDLAGRPGDSHLVLVDQKETRYIDCSDVKPDYGQRLVHDVTNRTETAMTQKHCFLATELTLRAEMGARRFGNLCGAEAP